MRLRRDIINGKLEIRPGLPGRHSRIFTKRRGAYGTSEEIIDASFDGRRDTEVEKCKCFAGKIDYLGHVISPGRLEIDNHTTEAIRGLKDPTTI